MTLHLLERHDARPRVDDHLDDVRAVVERLPHRAPRLFDAADHDVLVLDQLLRFGREAAELSARRGQRARRRDDARADDPSGVDRVAQRDVAVPAGIPEIAHGRDAGLEILATHRDAEQRAARRAHRRDGEHHVRIVVADAAFIVL